MNKLSLSLLFTALSITSAYAGTITATPKATATLASSCSMSAANADFGDITATTTASVGQDIKVNTNLTVTCSNNLPYSIAMNGGQHLNTSRYMIGTKGQLISYGLAQDASYSVIWFNSSVVSKTGTGAPQTIPVYLRTTYGFYTPDTYSDTLTATLTY